MDDIWGGAVDRMLARKSAVNTLDNRDPSIVRRANRVGASIGQPGQIVEADIDGFENEAKHGEAQSLFDTFPGLAAFAVDPQRNAAIKDDLPTMSQISGAFNLPAAKPRPIPSWRDNLMNSTKLPAGVGTTQLGDGSASEGPRQATPLNVVKGLGASIFGGVAEGIFGVVDAAAEGVGLGEEFRSTGYYTRSKQQYAELDRIANVGYTSLGKVGGLDINPGRWAYGAAGSLGQLGVAVLSGNPIAAFGTVSGGQFYETARDRGADQKEALRNATAYGAIEAGTEAIGLGWILGKFGKAATKRFVGGLLLREVPSELAATGGENFVDAMTTGGVGFEEYKKNLPQDLLDTAASTVLMLGAIGAGSAATRRLRPELRAQEDIAEGIAGANFLGALMDNAAKSKLKSEDPGTLRAFVEQHAENSPVRNVYFPVDDVVEYMQAEGYGGEFDQFQDQINEAQATADSVAIPLADAAAYLSGTSAWEALKESARATPGGFSLKEAREKSEELFQDLEARGAALGEEAKAKGVEQGAIDEAFEDIKNSILATGRVPANVAEATARIAAARYAVRGAEQGQTPLEAWKASGISILGTDEATGEVQGRMMGQQDETELAQEEPLAGMPRRIKVDGQERTFGPYRVGRQAAAAIAKRLGIAHTPPTTYARVDTDRAARIATEFELMEHNPSDPQVAAAYKAMIDETVEQYRELMKTGLKVEFIEGADPYGNPRNAIIDVVENNHLWVYPTDAGFGGPSSASVDVSDNPLLRVVPGIKISGRAVRANDLFRVVHDFFGHITEGVGFRADGEENAWRIHSAMYSPLARRAMTTETRGQNSWVNFGPFGEKNRTASGADTEYAPQKIGLLPEWVSEEGADDNETELNQLLENQDAFNSIPNSSIAVDPIGRRIAFHGTPWTFDEFRNNGPAVWFSEGRQLAERYADGRRLRKLTKGRVIEAELNIQRPLRVDDAIHTTPSTVVENPVAWAKEHFGFDLAAHGWERQGQDYAHAITRSAAFADAARAAGYDAIEITESGATTWGMLRPGSIVSRESQELFQSDDVFYSALSRAVADSKTAKASGAQWAATLRKTPGVRQEELEWTGLLDFLTSTEGPITRDQLTALLTEGGVQIEEVVLGDIAPLREQGIQRIMEDLPGTSRADAAEMWDDDPAQQFEVTEAGRDPQFKSWSSDPSNDTYRELLITLPPGLAGNPTRAPSTHWDTEGVVAHARFMDKTDADGKRVLFIEEVQSDWHQKGRDQGYETPVNKDAAKAAEEKYDAAVAALTEAMDELEPRLNLSAYHFEEGTTRRGKIAIALRNLNPALGVKFAAARDRVDLAGRERDIARGAITNGGVPNAPFKSSWPALVMKRMIRYAAENGYERIAWTTGKEQIDRYPSLAQTVGFLIAKKKGDDYVVMVENPDARKLIADNGMAAWNGSGNLIMSRAQLSAAFGNSVGEKLAAGAESGEEFTLEGEQNLQVGGEGMKAFYDRNLVNITNDIIKKHGAKVGPVAVAADKAKADFDKEIKLKLGALAMGIETAHQAEERAAEYEAMAERGEGDTQVARMWAKRLRDGKGLFEQRDKAAAGTPHPGFDITDSLKAAALQGQPLFQEKRGSVILANDGQRIIRLFGQADFSTLIHELGHVWLEEARADALGPNANPQRKKDWKATKSWFKANGFTVGDTGAIPVGAHELWARGTERFMMEGKSPSGALVGVFTKFRSWLMSIYSVVENLNSPITPEIRDVFSRLIATQEAIDEQRAIEKTEPLFKTAEEAGMTEAAFADYQSRIGEARDEAYNALLFKTMEALRRKRKAEMRDQRGNIRAEVAAEINAQSGFIALHLLRTGRWLGDPDREQQNVKLNTGWLIDTFGEDILDKLPKGLPITRGDGLEGDAIAEMVGASSGQELVHTLVGMRAASEELRATGETRGLRDKMIDEEVDHVMADRHGDALTDGSIEEEAIAALNTASQGEIISAEIRQLQKRTAIPGRVTPYQFVREWAKRKVAAGFVRDVASRGAMQRYTRAASKAARAAEAAILEGNADEAYRQKQAQLLNHALLAESKAAADRVDVIVARMKRLAGRAAMKSVDQDYMDKVHALLENYDFRERSQKSIDEQEGFQKWMESQRAQGYEVHIPPRLENNGDPYTRVTVEELEALNDVVESLLHLGKTKQSILSARAERDYAEWRDEAVARIALLPDRKLPDKPINEEARRGASAASELLKIEVITEELDGGPTGPLNDMLIVGANDAENKRGELRERVLAPIIALYQGLGRKQWKRLQEKVTLELTWNTLNEGDPRQGTPVVVTRMELLSMALNLGNLSNTEKMSKGERWPVATLQAIVQRELNKEDWDFVQALWTQVELLWPEIVKSERAMSGVVPEKVVNSPIDTRFGTYEGGYWPVVYDASRWQRAEDLEGAKLDDMFGLKSGVATQKGHTIERTAAFGPLSYSLENILFSHVEQVVTRIAFAPYARDVLRAIRDKRIRGMIDTKLGPEYRKQIEPWLSRQIHEGAVHAKAARWWQTVLRQFRINMTIAGMGFRLSTGVAQTLGLTASAQRIGARWVGTGMKRMAQNPRAAAQFVWDRSPEMLSRTSTFSREQAELAQNLRGKHSWLSTAQHWAMWHIGMMDRYVVSLPTWLGAHARGMSEGMTDREASDYADKSVRLSQGSGREKDLSAIQSPNNEAMRFFTMFYTPFNVMFNAQWQGVRGLKKGDVRPAIGVTFWWLLVSTLGDAMLSGDWPEDGDDDGAMDWGAWFARNVGFGLFAGIPVARDIATYQERKLSGEYASFGTPIDRVVDAMDRSRDIATNLIEDGEAPSRPLKTGGDLAAIFTGLPISQPATTGQFLWDYQAGEADPQSVSDWYFGITKGKVPEQ